MNSFDTIYYDGAWRESVASGRLEVTDPFTERVIATVPDGGAQDVDAAVRAAARAFPAWGAAPVADRAQLILRLAAEIEARADRFAACITSENGTPVAESAYASVQAAAHLRLVAGLGEQVLADGRRANPMTAGWSLVTRSPLGVAGLITPWNYPLSLIIIKLGPALIAGCTVVIKPAPETPLAARLLMDAVDAAGFPPGVVNLVTGGTEAGRALVEHPAVAKISFTGSTTAGRAIGEACGRLLRPVTLELGGKSPGVVLGDADAHVLAADILQVAMRNTGHTCQAWTRLIVPASRAKELTAVVADAVASAPIGDPRDPNTFFGPLVSRRHRDRVRDYIGIGSAEGARAVAGGGLDSPFAEGFFVQPTVFDRVEPGMRIAQEEIFGPVLSVLSYDTVEEAVRIANDSPYGLGGTVFGTDQDAALAVARRIDTGNIGINHYGSNAAAPFSGHKDSGIGTEFGLEGLGSYLSYTSIHFPS